MQTKRPGSSSSRQHGASQMHTLGTHRATSAGSEQWGRGGAVHSLHQRRHPRLLLEMLNGKNWWGLCPEETSGIFNWEDTCTSRYSELSSIFNRDW